MSAQNLITDHLDLWTQAVTQKSAAGRGGASGKSGKTKLTGIKKLRELILEMAVCGKLVEQDPDDEPAHQLLSTIEAEKSRLIAEKAIKKSKALASLDISNLPEIPENWSWVKLGDVLGIMDAGWSPACPSQPAEPGNWGVLKTTAVQVMKYLELENKKLPINKPPKEQYEVHRGDILITRAGPKNRVGISCVVKETRDKLMISDKIIRFNLIEAGLSEEYICLCLNAGETCSYLEHAKSGMAESQMNISQDKLKLAPMPLCPAEEQHRIVQKVDELMALCDRLEQHTSDQLDAHETLVDSLLGTLTQSANATELANNWARLAEHFDTLFTTDQGIDKLKQAILQLAVMGRLVEQNAGDEPAKSLIKCIDEEIGQRVSEGTIRKPKALALVEGSFPYELPKGWRWEKLGRFTLIGTGATPSRDRPDYYSPPEYPWVTSGETSQAFICDTNERVSSLAVKETNISIYPTGTLIVAMYGQGKTRGQITELKVAAGTNQACAAIQPIIEDASHRRYIKLCFVKLYDEIRENAAGGAQPNLNTGKIANTLIPFPPLAEQHRIVQKVDELMALCDLLKERLNQASDTRCQLAEAVVEGALS